MAESPPDWALPTQPKLSRVFCTFFTGTSSQMCTDCLGSVSPPPHPVCREPTQLLLSWFCWFLTGRSKQTSANWLLSDFGQTLGLLPLPPRCLRSRPVPVVCLSGLAAVCCGLAGVPGSGWPVCSCGLASLPRAFRPGHAQAMVRRLLDEFASIMDPVLYLHREA